MQVVLVRTVKYWWDKKAKVTEHVVTGIDADAVYAKCFKEYFNREKYTDSTRTRFKDPAHVEPYHAWVSDVRNYANNGGDMW